MIALYIKDVKPISSASAVQKHTIFQTVLYSEILKNAGYQGWSMKEIEFLNTKGVLLQKHLVILHLLVEFAKPKSIEIVLKMMFVVYKR